MTDGYNFAAKLIMSEKRNARKLNVNINVFKYNGFHFYIIWTRENVFEDRNFTQYEKYMRQELEIFPSPQGLYMGESP